MLPQCLDQHMTSLLIDALHSHNMAFQIARFDKLSQNELFERGRVEIEQAFDTASTLYQFCGKDDVAQAKRRRQNFAQRANIDHALSPEPLKRTDRATHVTKFAIIIIFYQV